MDQYFLIAKVHSTYGKDGFVRIISYSDFPDRFFSLKKVYVEFFDNKKEIIVQKVKTKKNFFLFKFENFNNDAEAKYLVNKNIFVSDSDIVELPEDHYFIHDLIGSAVYQKNLLIGHIKDVLSLSVNDVYVIQPENKEEELLIPAVKRFIENFDPQKKILTLEPDVELYDEN